MVLVGEYQSENESGEAWYVLVEINAAVGEFAEGSLLLELYQGGVMSALGSPCPCRIQLLGFLIASNNLYVVPPRWLFKILTYRRLPLHSGGKVVSECHKERQNNDFTID